MKDPKILTSPEDEHKNIVPMAERGKYSIEVTFDSKRSALHHAANACVVTIMRHRGDLGGLGGEQMFLCQAQDDFETHMDDEGRNLIVRKSPGLTVGCGGLIPPEAIDGGVAVCPECKVAWKRMKLATLIGYKATPQLLSEFLGDIFRRACGSNADFLIYYSPMDPRISALSDGNTYTAMRLARDPAIYPFGHLMRDLGPGADLNKLIKSFITA
jgi:hypothetical protein